MNDALFRQYSNKIFTFTATLEEWCTNTFSFGKTFGIESYNRFVPCQEFMKFAVVNLPIISKFVVGVCCKKFQRNTSMKILFIQRKACRLPDPFESSRVRINSLKDRKRFSGKDAEWTKEFNFCIFSSFL